jgi:putative tryptophan/tyrosine transport system substrate-binding protein
VSLIITSAPPPSRAAKDATATVPIVFVTVADPIGMGLVTNLARPGGNVTGLATIEWEAFTAKTLEIAKEVLPKSSRIAILMNPTNSMHTPGSRPGAGGGRHVESQTSTSRGAKRG